MMMTSLRDGSKVRTTVRTGGFTGDLRSVDDDRGPTAYKTESRDWRDRAESMVRNEGSLDEHDWDRGEVQAAPRGEDS
jgi:hypothetical protein